jgi:hypothetical protein
MLELVEFEGAPHNHILMLRLDWYGLRSLSSLRGQCPVTLLLPNSPYSSSLSPLCTST